MDPIELKSEYSNHFSEDKFLIKIYRLARKLGVNILFNALILYFLISDKEIPMHTRLVFMAALGYFILPMDIISDLIPGLGFTDDLAFITYAITVGRDHITKEVSEKAKERLDNIFNGKKEGKTRKV
ncbi:MAG: DUF1232 domain-containing protein [Chlorobi bacterium]|nr:DUF1232 domain-containing protein [Chlorobiota bacterium]